MKLKKIDWECDSLYRKRLGFWKPKTKKQKKDKTKQTKPNTNEETNKNWFLIVLTNLPPLEFWASSTSSCLIVGNFKIKLKNKIW